MKDQASMSKAAESDASRPMDPDTAERQGWMALLAKANSDDLEAAWEVLENKPAWRLLRKPEIGLVMVRGRAGGTGRPFNLGEMTVTRCVLASEEGFTGHATVAGRNLRHAELAAGFDALLQNPARREALNRGLIAELKLKQDRAAGDRAAKAAKSKVEFFTLVRGED